MVTPHDAVDIGTRRIVVLHLALLAVEDRKVSIAIVDTAVAAALGGGIGDEDGDIAGEAAVADDSRNCFHNHHRHYHSLGREVASTCSFDDYTLRTLE